MFRKIGLTLATLLGISSICFGGLVYQPNIDYRIKSLETIGRVSASSFLSSGPIYLGGTVYNPLIVNSSGTFLNNVQIIGNFALVGNILNPSTFASSVTVKNQLQVTAPANFPGGSYVVNITSNNGVSLLNVANSGNATLRGVMGAASYTMSTDGIKGEGPCTGNGFYEYDYTSVNKLYPNGNSPWEFYSLGTAGGFNFYLGGAASLLRAKIGIDGNFSLLNSTASLKIGSGATISTITANSADFGNNASIAQTLSAVNAVFTSTHTRDSLGMVFASSSAVTAVYQSTFTFRVPLTWIVTGSRLFSNDVSGSCSIAVSTGDTIAGTFVVVSTGASMSSTTEYNSNDLAHWIGSKTIPAGKILKFFLSGSTPVSVKSVTYQLDYLK